MRGRSSDLRTGLVPALALSLALILCLRPAFAAVDPKGNFPVEIKLTGLSRPSGIVTGRNTFVYIATVGGKLFRVDIQSGSTTLINAGGDGRALAGLCTDERGAGTLYAAGRESGRLYAFSRDGPLQRIFQLTNASTVDEPHFISDCISTRHRLLVSDAYASAYLYIRLPDRDPEDPSEPKVLGLPPPLNPDFALQGFEVPFRGAAGGAWPVMSPGLFGAASLEWTAKWNDTAYVMYSSLGQLFAFNITSPASAGANARAVVVEGAVQRFPGALNLRFDSKNENVMYIALPSNNSLAVLEFADRYRAKYIRTIDGLLLNRPIDLAEYGDYIFPISGHFGETLADREAGNYSLPRIGRHRQDISEIIDTEDPFTPTFENVKRPPPLRKPLRPLQVLKELQEPPKKTGITPDEPALDTKPSEEPTAGEARTGRTAPTGVGNVFGEVTDNVTPKKKRACFPAAATVLLEGGRRVAMRQLRIGDRVQASSAADGTPLFSTVYLFSHKDAEARSEFVEATFDNGWQLRLSPGHYMLIDGGLVAAGNVGVGKCLTSDRNVCVMSVRRVRDVGLFNPHTMDGRVVVDDVQVSTFTTAVAPAAARGILAPVRLLYRWHLRVAARILSGALVQGSPGRIGRLLSL